MNIKTIWELLDLSGECIQVFVMFFYIEGIFKRKFDSKKSYLFAYLLGLVALMAVDYFYSVGNIMAISILLVVSTIVFTLYEGKLLFKSLSILLFMVFFIASDTLLYILLMPFAGDIQSKIMQPGFDRMVGKIMTCLLLFWIIILVIKILKKKVEVVPFKYWILICLIPIISIFILRVTTWIIKSNIPSGNIIIIFILLGIFYINFAVFDLIESYSKQIKLKVMEELFERETENYKMLEITERELKTLKHDINNHICSIEAMLKQGEISTAKEHLHSLKTITDELGSVVYTGNLAIDAILNSKGVIAHEFGLSYSIRASLFTPITIEPVDICIIFGNAIDNAIEACNRIKGNKTQKYIFISIELFLVK